MITPQTIGLRKLSLTCKLSISTTMNAIPVMIGVKIKASMLNPDTGNNSNIVHVIKIVVMQPAMYPTVVLLLKYRYLAEGNIPRPGYAWLNALPKMLAIASDIEAINVIVPNTAKGAGKKGMNESNINTVGMNVNNSLACMRFVRMVSTVVGTR